MLCLSVLLAGSLYAEEPADFLKNVEITLKPAKEIQVQTEDEKLAKAISEASTYAYSMREDLMYFSYQNLLLIVKKCRYTYKRDNETMDFIEYIKQDLDKHYVNCNGWINYVGAFNRED